MCALSGTFRLGRSEEGLALTYTLKVQIKVKFALEQAIKAQRGSRCIAVLFL
jgi:hypothetical protein